MIISNRNAQIEIINNKRMYGGNEENHREEQDDYHIRLEKKSNK
jgi:hypothetical protein